jgi:hypothetical protein
MYTLTGKKSVFPDREIPGILVHNHIFNSIFLGLCQAFLVYFYIFLNIYAKQYRRYYAWNLAVYRTNAL